MSDYRTGKQKKVRYHFSIVFFASVIIFGLMFFKYYKTTTLEDVLSEDRNITIPALTFNSPDDKDKDDDSAGEDKAIPSVNGEIINPVAQSEAADKSYFDKCVFIGDFIPYGMLSYEVVPASSVYASMSLNVSNADTQTVETQFGSMTVLAALEEKSFENIYIMLGSNGAAWMSVSDMYTDYISFVNKIRAACSDSRIFIVSVPPVTAIKEQSKESPISNADIDSFNEKLLDYANSNNMYYLDINTYFKDDSAAMPTDLAENDGLHFKHSAYEKLTDYILCHTAK